jgi:hypothetical protein
VQRRKAQGRKERAHISWYCGRLERRLVGLHVYILYISLHLPPLLSSAGAGRPTPLSSSMTAAGDCKLGSGVCDLESVFSIRTCLLNEFIKYILMDPVLYILSVILDYEMPVRVIQW